MNPLLRSSRSILSSLLLWFLSALHPGIASVTSADGHINRPQNVRQIQAAGSKHVHNAAAVSVSIVRSVSAQQKLFETPGGAYTRADIAANGNTTPDIKYAGLMAEHHLNPKKGTYICPVTKTQANKKFAWIVGGKKYLFCCPPCIAEFVKQSKDKPGGLRPPETYIQR